MRSGVAIGQVMTVDPGLRFDVRTGISGRVHSILLRPASVFIEEVRGESRSGGFRVWASEPDEV